VAIVGDSYLLCNHVDNGAKRKAVDLLPSVLGGGKQGGRRPLLVTHIRRSGAHVGRT
jgi:hypothetical protein